ncbi:hypothetical protein DevBK_00640 [Devosia sp. BK]|jgi:hypothetical protein|nr:MULTISPECIES: hypothetical protein [unclassified Devosia]MDV3249826.1 hypothetical protein [Devosia sp. BK]
MIRILLVLPIRRGERAKPWSTAKDFFWKISLRHQGLRRGKRHIGKTT